MILRTSFYSIFLVAIVMLAACSTQPNEPVAVKDKRKCRKIEDGPVMSRIMVRPALPDSTITSLSDKLEYILETDHEDRMNGTVFSDVKRDSLRLSQVLAWYNEDMINTWEDKYRAGFIFLHKGGPLMAENAEYLKIAQKMFADVARETTDPQIKEESRVLSVNALESYLNWLFWEEVAMMRQQQAVPPINAGT